MCQGTGTTLAWHIQECYEIVLMGQSGLLQQQCGIFWGVLPAAYKHGRLQ